MRKTTIKGIDAAGDMRRNLHRESMRHRRKTRERLVEIVIVATAVLGVALGVNAYLRHADASRPLPETYFEQQARIAAAAKKAAPSAKKTIAAKPRKQTRSGGSDAEVASKSSGGSTKPAAKPSTSDAHASSTPSTKSRTSTPLITSAAVRRIHVAVSDSAFAPARIEVPYGAQLQIDVDAAPSVTAAGFEIPSFSLSSDNTSDAVKVFVGAPTRGTYEFQSFNRKLMGTLVVK